MAGGYTTTAVRYVGDVHRRSGVTVTAALTALEILLLVALLLGLVRIAKGPTRGDRMMAAQLFGSTGVAVLLVLAEIRGEPAFTDVALVFTLLATVNALVFVRHGRDPGEEEADGS
jgi:multicomponent Na+:H+ antiporter subunit F